MNTGTIIKERKITELIPVIILGIMLVVYIFSLVGGVRHIVWILSFLFIGLFAGLYVLQKFQKKRNPDMMVMLIKMQKQDFLVLAVYVLALGMTGICNSTHFVTNWDDLNYWALFPRNMYAIDCMPTGISQCTQFKDYLPIIQQFYYLGFKLIGHFSEPLMFMINNWLLYTFLLPFLYDRKEKSLLEKGAGILIYFIFPHVLQFQQLHCLGVDCIMGVLFGYLIISLADEKRDLFYYVRFAAGTSVLMLSKTSGALFAMVVLIAYLVKHLQEKRKWSIVDASFLIPVLFRISWTVFCKMNGNYSYLSQRVENNISTGITFPAYTLEVILKFIRYFFTFSLNQGRFGCSAAVVIIICLGLCAFITKEEKRTFFIMLSGYVLYVLFLLYTYLFVFDDWEAKSLSSYDRYMAVYLVALLMVQLQNAKVGRKILFAGTLLLLVSLNYQMLFTHLIPTYYDNYYSKQYEEKSGLEKEFETVRETFKNPAGKLLIVSAKEDMELNKYAQYAAVPMVSECYSFTEEEPIEQKIQERGISDVYLRTDCYEPKDLKQSGFEPGRIYHIEKE